MVTIVGAAVDDEARLAELCEREHGRLVRLLTLYTGDPWLADELAQEALVRLCARWRRDEVRNVAAWLNRVGVNLANSTFRRRAAARRAAVRHGASPTEHRPPDTADAMAVREAVAALPARPREAVVLRYFEGWTTDEVGAHLGIGASSVRSLLSRAITQLREQGLVELPADPAAAAAVTAAAANTASTAPAPGEEHRNG